MKKYVNHFLLAGMIVVSGGLYANADEIAQVINCFAGKNNDFPIEQVAGVGPMRMIKVGGKTYFGVHKNDQNKINYVQFKSKFMELRGLKNRRAIQLVGDSGLRSVFTPEATEFVRQFLKKEFDGDHILEYGYTGGQIPRQQLDVNSFINEYLDDNPDQAPRVLANILAHTVYALKNWKCVVSPKVINFVVVYNEDGVEGANFTKFGDDVTISDNLLTAQDGDKVICLEGGAQSFNQATRSLELGLQVDYVSGLRQPENYTMFSAAQFVSRILGAFKKNKEVTQPMVRDIAQGYFGSLVQMFDPKKEDFYTKKSLFDAAETKFEEQLFKRLPMQGRLLEFPR